MRWLPPFVLLSFALACGGGTSSAPAETPAVDPALQSAADALAKKWEVDAGGWNKALVIAPWGDVIALERSKLHVLAREDGRTLQTVTTCVVEQVEAAFLDEHVLAIGCEGGKGQHITFPAGTTADGKAPTVDSPSIDGLDAGAWIKDTVEYEGLIATGGSSGLLVFAPSGGKPLRELDSDSAIGVAADKHGVCVGTTKGEVKCFAAGALPVSTYAAKTADAGATGDSSGDAAAPAAAGGTHEGTIKSAGGGTVVLTTSGGSPPSVGAKGTLSKQVNKKFGQMNITAWLDIAEVEVTRVSGGTVTCKITKETTDITVNGRKQDQFVKGAATKLKWAGP